MPFFGCSIEFNFPPSAIAVVRLHPDKSGLRSVLYALAFTHPTNTFYKFFAAADIKKGII